METLDSDLLRTFLAVADAGSLTGGAERIFRSQSAASVQIKRLESLLGQPVFERHGRGVVLTPAGEKLEGVAREVVRRLDAALSDLKADGLEGALRVGIPDDHSQPVLSKILADFARAHPRVELVVRSALSAGFPASLRSGALDLAVHEVETLGPGMTLLREERTFWMTSRRQAAERREPLPVALFDRDCWWRDAALATLRARGCPYRVAYSSESATGVAAAVEAGVGVGLLGASAVRDDFVILGEADGFGPTPASKLVLELREGFRPPSAEAMATTIREAFGAEPTEPRDSGSS